MPGGKGGKTKHDRCVEHVQANSPDVSNPHAVCVASGVKPDKWKKGRDMKDDLIKALVDAGQRESALLLKNWGEMDDAAKLMKSKLEKQMLPPSGQAAPPAAPAQGEANMAKEQGGLKGPGTLIDRHEAGHKQIASDIARVSKVEECHEDDPKHEAKEKKIAEKQKKLAEKQLDLHKEEDNG